MAAWNSAESAAGKSLDDVDGGIRRDGISKFGAVEDWFTVDEDGHVLPERALVIENIAAGGRIRGEVGIESLADIGTVHGCGRAGDVSLDILGKAYVGHTAIRGLQFLPLPRELSSTGGSADKRKRSGLRAENGI